MREARSRCVFALIACAAFPTTARAEDDSRDAKRATAARERGAPFTMVEAGIGTLALPAAEVCPSSLDECTTGEISLALGIRNLYEFGRFGLGAGILWATTLRNDVARGADDLERDHARRYFLFEGYFRYTFVRSEDWDLWGGASLGGVFVNDSWTVKLDREPKADVQFLGPQASTIGTEGIAVGAGVGAAWIFFPNLSVGGALRYQNWIFPGEPETNPTGDIASLSGRVDTFDVSLSIAYRLSL